MVPLSPDGAAATPADAYDGSSGNDAEWYGDGPLLHEEYRSIHDELLDEAVNQFKADCTGKMSVQTRRKQLEMVFNEIDEDESGK